ncbi:MULTISPECIES: ATP-dependent zinc metalloprotease FtsH [Neisseria]|uniref:ATP-dependent zinc metalloprotease FtsH n=1 Tax=Neisseria musculi TaxID=1815583 RepID=A0A7H1MDC4_9NEIS|nr:MULTISPECIES: ATP-dependent zinc metalloprotease FtsH [Neisseria]MBF0803403.1 ATP-dependent zinc metalloprotease FtsH [Neisseria sp. 19428wB4_WF04]QNT59639.1 ATP-dependent metallopeptidase HflB family protein [Neisseria musculi]TFU43913.1 ATP-dependent metallopeptidase FtsH/Yme1/Tma family protein [Neisseria sp. WF04]
MGNMLKNVLVWLVLIVAMLMAFNAISDSKENKQQIEYSQFIEQVNKGEIANVNIEGSVVSGYLIKGTRTDKTEFFTNAPLDEKLVPTLLDKKVRVKVTPEEKPSMLTSLLFSLLPVMLLIGAWFYFMRMQAGGGGKGGAFSFGKSRAKLLDKDTNKVTFADVAGCDEAKEEVQEIVDYLKAPNRYQSLGGRVPRGILLAGSPGTGKTLLAKAIAGEAQVPFFSISGSDFVEMFVGVGASRVRDMFEQAKKNAPCIIFIDEIDAVGRQRGAGLGGGNDEREQTLNQLLVEMDGFESNQTVIVIAATNRPDVLDPALQRPGRFDRQVVVPLPDIRGREQILKVHAKKVPLDESVDLVSLARGTPGFSGADLANLVNEAALFAGRRNKVKVDQSDFEDAKDKIYMGPERRSMVMHEDEKRATAYHEAGHAIVAESLEYTDPVHKVTIMPRGRALGLTWQLPERDRISMYKDQMLSQISILYGGRIAEDLFVGRISTGASNDFERATQIAREMVTRFGMSDKMGQMVYAENEGEVFLGRSVTRSQHISEKTQREVDAEIRRILDEQYAVAYKILDENRDKMETMCKALMEWETIDRDQVLEIMDGKQPSPPKDYSYNIRKDGDAAAQPPAGNSGTGEAENNRHASEEKITGQAIAAEAGVSQEMHNPADKV